MFRTFRPSFEGLERREVFSTAVAFVPTEEPNVEPMNLNGTGIAGTGAIRSNSIQNHQSNQNPGLVAGTLGRGVIGADFNGDGRPDLAIWARQAQANAVAAADFDGDGDVDGADFLAARANANADDTNKVTAKAHDAFFSALGTQGTSIWINQDEIPLAEQDDAQYFITGTELPAVKSVVSDPSDQGVIYLKSKLGPASLFRNGGGYSNISHTYDSDLA